MLSDWTACAWPILSTVWHSAGRNWNRSTRPKPLLRRALAIRELNLGPCSVEVARTTDQLGLLFFHTKRPAEAEPFYNRSLDILLGALGPGNPLLARSYDNLAVTKAILEKLDEAEPLYREALCCAMPKTRSVCGALRSC